MTEGHWRKPALRCGAVGCGGGARSKARRRKKEGESKSRPGNEARMNNQSTRNPEAKIKLGLEAGFGRGCLKVAHRVEMGADEYSEALGTTVMRTKGDSGSFIIYY